MLTKQYPYLSEIAFVGDLSLQDANVLSEWSFGKDVLEFGSGGSTQIFAQCANSVVSVETDPAWIKKTESNLRLIANPCSVQFVPYDLFRYDNKFDFVFVDGALDKRLNFAVKAWDCLQVGGVMMFHDTRHFENFKEAAWLMQLKFAEIDRVCVNHDDSNLTLITKRHPVSYVNWNETENKPKWAYGIGDRPEGAGLWKLND
jgi:hypothetical protein